jgi:hypothetical protein
MFRIWTAIFTLLSLTALVFAYSMHVRIRSRHAAHYRDLVRESVELRARRALEKHPAHQMRDNVQKDLWLPEDRHARIKSKTSMLTLKQRKDKVEAVEELLDIECCIQDKGLMRRVVAEQGVYKYPSHTFDTDHVQLAFHHWTGGDIPTRITDPPYLTGLAETISLAFMDQTPIFHAEKWHAALASTYLFSAGDADYNGTDLHLSNGFQIAHPMGDLSANKATLCNFEKKEQARLFLEEDVCLDCKQGKIPVTISSHKADSLLSPGSLFSQINAYEINFYDTVSIQALDDVSARGGRAQYRSGVLSLYPAIPITHCQLVRGDDRIDAEEVRFDLLREELSCIHPIGRLHEVGSEPLFFSCDVLSWHIKQSSVALKTKVHIEQPGLFSLNADKALLFMQERWQCSNIDIEGTVQIASRLSTNAPWRAICDRAQYEFTSQTLTLSSKSPRKVLFVRDGFCMSAPEIRLQKNPLTGDERIDVDGNVHFAIETNDEDVMEELLSRYLNES